MEVSGQLHAPGKELLAPIE